MNPDDEREHLQVFLKNYHAVVSLGYNCYVKLALNHLGIRQSTYLFDYTGSSMSSINAVLAQPALTWTLADMINRRVYDSGDEHMWTHKRNLLRFKHDFEQTYTRRTPLITQSVFAAFLNKYTRQWHRWQQLCGTVHELPLLFVRIEAELSNQVLAAADRAQQRGLTDLDHLQMFAQRLREQYPSLLFQILFFANTNQASVPDLNIKVVVKPGPLDVLTGTKLYNICKTCSVKE